VVAALRESTALLKPLMRDAMAHAHLRVISRAYFCVIAGDATGSGVTFTFDD
jgi:hypothetical protein